MTDVRHARTLASTMLATELPRRGRSWLVSAAWLHDVGYASPLVETGFHPIDGARHLRRLAADECLVNLVALHSCASVEASLRALDDVLALELIDPMRRASARRLVGWGR